MGSSKEDKIILERYNGKPFAVITYHPEGNWCRVTWDGFLPVELVKEGSEALLQMFKSKQGCTKILADISKVAGPWNKANKWFDTDWNPRAVAAGLQNMAVIVPEDIFIKISLQGFEKVSTGNYQVENFDSELSAKEWLRNV